MYIDFTDDEVKTMVIALESAAYNCSERIRRLEELKSKKQMEKLRLASAKRNLEHYHNLINKIYMMEIEC